MKFKLYLFIKRTFDIILSFLGIIILIIPFLLISLIIKIDSSGPVLFKQKRIGKNKKCFYILKFRTMKKDTPHDLASHLLTNSEQYITKFGFFLRKTHIDELPQLFNILVGQMSFVGPRPALWNQYDLIQERDKYKANSLRPGLTGLAQTYGRYELPISLKAKLDGDYIKKISFYLDCSIIFKTLFKIYTIQKNKED